MTPEQAADKIAVIVLSLAKSVPQADYILESARDLVTYGLRNKWTDPRRPEFTKRMKEIRSAVRVKTATQDLSIGD